MLNIHHISPRQLQKSVDYLNFFPQGTQMPAIYISPAPKDLWIWGVNPIESSCSSRIWLGSRLPALGMVGKRLRGGG